jgi:hypothetical protein
MEKMNEKNIYIAIRQHVFSLSLSLSHTHLNAAFFPLLAMQKHSSLSLPECHKFFFFYLQIYIEKGLKKNHFLKSYFWMILKIAIDFKTWRLPSAPDDYACV